MSDQKIGRIAFGQNIKTSHGGIELDPRYVKVKPVGDYKKAADLLEQKQAQADAISAARDRVVEAAIAWRRSENPKTRAELAWAADDLRALTAKAKEGSDGG